MTSNDQRRFYRLNIVGAICFLMGVLLFQSGDVGEADFQMYLARILLLVGMILCVIAFGTIMYSEDHVEYTYEDDIEDKKPMPSLYRIEEEDEEEVQYENLP